MGDEAEQDRIEELERQLDELTAREQRRERDFANGRAIGAQSNKARAEHHREFWAKEADRILQREPNLTLEEVALRVRDKSLTIGYTIGERPYKFSTIHRFLVDRAKSGQTTQRSLGDAR